MIEFKENKWTHRANRAELKNKFNKNWENIHTVCVHGEYWVYWNVPGDVERENDASYSEFIKHLESSNFDFSHVCAEAENSKEDEEVGIKLNGPPDDNYKINQYPSVGDLNYFADHRLLIIKIDNSYCIFHTKLRPSNLLLENIIEHVEMPQDIDLPIEKSDSGPYCSESNMKPEFIEETYYIYFTNQELSQNFNDEVLILTDNIKQEFHSFDQSSTSFEEYRSYVNMDDALETMYQILNTKN